MTGLGLMMIVKDEEDVIGRCLESVRDFVDWWVIADTGSSDGTRDLVRDLLRDVPGDLVERPWVNFGHNRNEVLDLARQSPHAQRGDYGFWLDADDFLVDKPGQRLNLDLDGYKIRADLGSMRYHRISFVRLDRPWRWRGPLHEYLELNGATLGDLSEPRLVVSHGGARSKDPDTYARDAQLLEAALLDEPGNPRYQFYLAQSRRDAGELEEAVALYRERVANPEGWSDEAWYAQFQIGVLRERLGDPVDEVIGEYLAAYNLNPLRAEPLVEVARLERARERFALSLLYARAATRIPLPPTDALFVDDDTYKWRAWDEVSVSSYWLGRYADGMLAAQRALQARPDDPRLRANLAWNRSRLTE